MKNTQKCGVVARKKTRPRKSDRIPYSGTKTAVARKESQRLGYNNSSSFPFSFSEEKLMMNRRLLCIMVPLLLIASRVFAAPDSEPSAEKKAPSEFAGKIVCVQMTNERVVLENVNIIVHGTQSFLAGTGVKRNDLNTRHAWWEGLPIRLNLRFVEAYFLVTPQQWTAVRNTFVIPGPPEP
jgi:hypothetical protein